MRSGHSRAPAGRRRLLRLTHDRRNRENVVFDMAMVPKS
jgi:hypothetical protein